MSKQSEAKIKQDYVAKAIPQTCQHCAFLNSKLELPRWMREHNNGHRQSPQYNVAEHGIMTDLRCEIGGFAVKKMGTCIEYAGKP